MCYWKIFIKKILLIRLINFLVINLFGPDQRKIKIENKLLEWRTMRTIL